MSLGVAVLAGVAATASAESNSIKVGIMSGEDEDVWRTVTAEAAKKGAHEPLIASADRRTRR